MEKPNYPNCRMKMEPNNHANNGRICSHSLKFQKNMGRLSRLSLAERKKIARKGGLAKSERKKLSSQLNPIKTGKATSVFSISRCDECQSKHDCDYYRKDSACQVELNIRRSTIHKFKAFVSDKPEGILIEIMKIFNKLEKITEEDPSFYKLSQLVYMLMNLYRMKFYGIPFKKKLIGDKYNISLDIKKAMKELRNGGVVPKNMNNRF